MEEVIDGGFAHALSKNALEMTFGEVGLGGEFLQANGVRIMGFDVSDGITDPQKVQGFVPGLSGVESGKGNGKLHEQSGGHDSVSGGMGVGFVVQLVDQFADAAELAFGELKSTAELMLIPEGGFERKEGVKAGQGADVPLVHPQFVGIVEDVGQGEVMHVLILMQLLGRNHEDIPAFDREGLPVDEMEGGAFEDNHEFVEAMAVQGEFRLRVPQVNLQGEVGVVEIVPFSEMGRGRGGGRFRHVHIVLKFVGIVKVMRRDFCDNGPRFPKPEPEMNPMTSDQAYELAQSRYADFGVDTDAAIAEALELPISLHCWQADDVAGFETKPEGLAGGGILATGNYPGRARNGEEARADIAKAMSLIPGKQRVNVHACYSETEDFVDRDAMDASCFRGWMDWAGELGVALDFNPTFFAHPLAEDGFTLSHPDEKIRSFWIRHGKACRKIAEAMAREQGSPCLLNWWTPDGAKDLPADRFGPRARMAAAYDEIFSDDSVDRNLCVDYLESKLFGIASEEYVVSSAEFCADYALSRKVGLCMDMGHFHPTETIHGKISSHLQFMEKLLLHVSRPVRWDSDHVVILNDDLKNVFLEIQRGGVWDRVAVALDFFDASINRLGAYVIGTRAARKAILYARLDPTRELQDLEASGKHTHRLALMEEFKSMPFGPVWDRLCEQAGVPMGTEWLVTMEAYERSALSLR